MPNHPDRPVDAPADADAPRTVLLLFPGLSIMQRRWLSPRVLLVRCPGCYASQIVSTAVVPATFVHESDDCPILLRIEMALTMLKAAQEGEHN